MRLNALIAAVSAIALLSGCGFNYRDYLKTDPAPPITYDDGPREVEATKVQDAHIREYVEVPVPMPMPGQAKPLPTAQAPRPTVKDTGSPTERVEKANAAARYEPVGKSYMDAIQVYDFHPGALFQVYCTQDQVTDITLQEGETLKSMVVGDTVRWVIADTSSGEGSSERVHVMVKPIRPDLHTNLILNTNRRTYRIELHADPRTYMAAVEWQYPYDQLVLKQQQTAQAEARAPLDTGINIADLRFRYTIKQVSGKPAWTPTRVYDDTAKTYIEFPHRLDQGEAPPLFIVNPNGDVALVNYRQKGHFYIVDRLFSAAELRLGNDPQEIVRIERTDTQTAQK